jgi:hypothetical protein
VRLVPSGGDGGQHGQVRVDVVDGPGEFCQRGVRAEVVHAPAVAVQDDPERHQAQVMLLAGRAGQDSAGAVAVTPSAGQAGQASAQDAAGEMLTCDAGLPAGPAVAEAAQIGQDHLAQDGFGGEVGQQPVQGRLRGRLVEAIQAGGQGRGSPGQALAAGGRRGGAGAQDGARGLGRGQAAGQVGLHAADPALVRFGVQAVAAGCPGRLEQPVPPFPGAQQLGADAGAAAQLADLEARRRLVRHPLPFSR